MFWHSFIYEINLVENLFVLEAASNTESKRFRGPKRLQKQFSYLSSKFHYAQRLKIIPRPEKYSASVFNKY